MTPTYSSRYSVAISCMLLLAFTGAACAQTLSADKTTVNFTVPSGGFATQQVDITTTASTTIFINTTGVPSWLTVSPSGPVNLFTGSPLMLNVTANAAGLTAGMNLTGQFTVGVESSNSTPITITVDLSVAAASALTTSQPSLSFSVAGGTSANNIPTQSFTVASSTTALSYTVSATTTDGNNWLVPVTVSGNTASAPTVTVGVNPGNLPAGIYHGTLFITSISSTDTASVAVTMTISAPATLSATPTSLPQFLYQVGTTPTTGQLTQTLMVSSAGSSAAFTIAVNPPAPWLIVNPSNGATGTAGAAVPITLTVNPTGLTPGVYSTNVTISAIGGNSLAPIQVQLVVSNNPLLQVSKNQLSFQANLGTTISPASQSVQVTTVGNGSESFTFSSDSPWLSATASSGSTPSTLTISVNAIGLAVGNYTGMITVRPTGPDANLYSIPIAVNLAVSSTTTLTAAPPLLVFSYQIGGSAPLAQLVQIAATGQTTTFSIATTSMQTMNCPANWLSANASSSAVTSTAPAALTVMANVTGMTAGVCSGNIAVTYPASGTNQTNFQIPVTVNVSATPVITVNMPLGFGVFTFPAGSSPQFSSITLGSTDGSALQFTVNATSNGPSPWLFVGANGSTTLQTLQVQIVPGTLPPNTYSGTITITSASLPQSPLTIPITLTLTSSATVTLSNPGPLNFAQAAGGPPPASQTVQFNSSATGESFQVSIPSTIACSWLAVNPSSGPATGSVTFTPQANTLAQNTYTCPVTFSFLNSASSPVVVNAILTVGPAATVSASVTSLSFAYQLGQPAPAPQPIMISSTGGTVNFTVGTTSTGGWLTTDAGTSTLATPKTINVSINPANIPPSAQGGQALNGSITITAPGVLANPITIPVTLNLTAAVVPNVSTILNSASNISTFTIAPGELITIKGTNLGPSTPAGGTSFTVNLNGTVSPSLAGTTVLFNGIAGTSTFVSATQINVIVPWELNGQTSSTIVVEAAGGSSTPATVTVTSISPGVYTLSATGQGQASATDVSTGNINGPATGVTIGGSITIHTFPAAAGSFISVYGTGGGVTSPIGIDGTLNSGTSLMPFLNWTQGSSSVTATIGGQPAFVQFAGAAPTLITGVWQLNIQIPTGLASGPQPLLITINGQQTQSNVTIAVQ